MDIKIPGSNGEQQTINVPLITLSPQSSIKIKELSMEMKVKMGSFGKRKSIIQEDKL